MKSKKIFFVILFVVLFIGTAVALTSNGFNLINYLIPSSGGDVISNSGKKSYVAAGQNIVGNSKSAGYSMKFGYIVSVSASNQEVARANLDDAYVYPNPYKPSSGGGYDADYITFSDITRTATIEVYNIAGELVATIEKDSSSNEEQWGATNNAGKSLASGVYIFYISNDKGHKKVGRFAIIK